MDAPENRFDMLDDFEQWLWVIAAVATGSERPGQKITLTMDNIGALAERIHTYGYEQYMAGVENTKQQVADDLREGIANAIRACLESDEGL